MPKDTKKKPLLRVVPATRMQTLLQQCLPFAKHINRNYIFSVTQKAFGAGGNRHLLYHLPGQGLTFKQ